MKQPTVFEGIGVAAITSLAGAAGFSMLAFMMGSGSVFRLMIAMMALGYVVYLLLRSNERVGRVSVITIWSVVAVVNFVLTPSFLLYVVIHLVMIWLVRVLYFYHGVLPALLDLGLTGLSVMTAVWAWVATGSLLLSFWCFFLVQSLFVLIPKKLSTNSQQKYTRPESKDRFERAHHAAELAVRKLTRIH